MMDGSFSASCDPEQPVHSLRAVRRGTILFLAIGVICAAGGYALPGSLRYHSGSAYLPPECRLHPYDVPPCRYGFPARPRFLPHGDAPAFFRATFSDGDKATLHVSFPGAEARPNCKDQLQIKLMNTVMTRLFRKSANRLPTSGISRYALTEGEYLSQMACMFAMALGVAPMPKPQVPDTMTAAS